MTFTDVDFGQYLISSIVWFLAGIGVGSVGRDVISLAKAYRGES